MATQTLSNVVGKVNGTGSSIALENKTFYERALLERLLANLVFAKYGQKKTLPKHEGDTVNFRKFNKLAVATTPLTDGTTPSGSSLSMSAVEATIAQYGDFVQISDKLDMVGIDPVLTETAQLLGEQAALTIDTVVREAVCASTNVQYAGGKLSTTITASDKITYAEIMKAVRTLRNNNAKPLSDGCYIGIVDPSTAYDIMNDSMWRDISKYNGGVKLMDGEIGKLGGVRFIQTTNTKVSNMGSGSAVAAHCVPIFGENAYGVIDLEGSSRKPSIIVKGFGSAGTTDPLNQRATAGWKAEFAAKILDNDAIVNLFAAVS